MNLWERTSNGDYIFEDFGVTARIWVMEKQYIYTLDVHNGDPEPNYYGSADSFQQAELECLTILKSVLRTRTEDLNIQRNEVEDHIAKLEKSGAVPLYEVGNLYRSLAVFILPRLKLLLPKIKDYKLKVEIGEMIAGFDEVYQEEIYKNGPVDVKKVKRAMRLLYERYPALKVE